MGVDLLGEGLEELGELAGGLVREFGKFQDQTGWSATSWVGSVVSDIECALL